MSRHWNLFVRTSSLRLSAEMAYKLNFWIKSLAITLSDFIGPLFILLIYTTTSGIEGWTFPEFILFQGTLIFAMGFSHVFFAFIGVQVIDMVRLGKFDSVLVKPYNPLVYLTLSSFDWDGLGELLVGFALLVWAFIVLGITVFSWNFLVYLFVVLLALLFFYSIIVTICALSFLLIKSWALFALFFRTMDFAKYPLDIYGSGLRVLFTFFLPLGVASFYPAKALLEGLSGWTVLQLTISVGIIFGISLILWHFAMKKYSSAGG
tara:strand:+ start:2812 stop:3600 length:789 start_codon:yes stop_codon:yes gene_type:complete